MGGKLDSRTSRRGRECRARVPPMLYRGKSNALLNIRRWNVRGRLELYGSVTKRRYRHPRRSVEDLNSSRSHHDDRASRATLDPAHVPSGVKICSRPDQVQTAGKTGTVTWTPPFFQAEQHRTVGDQKNGTSYDVP